MSSKKEIRNAPKEPGWYWAMWLKASPRTHEGDQLTPSEKMEVVEVWLNDINEPDDEQFGVSVTGVRETQWLNNFKWGPRVSESF